MSDIFRGEVWLLNLDPTLGREQAGTRPALIISDNIFNQSYAELVIVVPVTSQNKNIRSQNAKMFARFQSKDLSKN